jgi:hypothetical protein
LKNVPTIKSWSDEGRGSFPDEYVAAGLGIGGSVATQYASTLKIEEGGAIKGVENLYGDGTLRYNSANNMFTAIRSEWILVGGVIKQFDEEHPGEVRKVRSGDFYIADHKPHVYMQHFKLDDNSNIVPGVPFTSLAEEVDETTAFGIYIPDQYGDYKLPASIYYEYMEKDPSKINDAKVNKTFTFEGRFANEADLPEYTISGTGLDKCSFVNNSYPANLTVAKLRYDNSGLDVKVYDYVDKNWDTEVPSSQAEGSAVYVKPNNGFAIKASSAKTITTNQRVWLRLYNLLQACV